MKILTYILIALIPLTGWTYVEHPIYEKIISYNIIKPDRAMLISNIIHKVAKKNHVNPILLTAIIRQESAFHLGARGCHVGIDPENNMKRKVCSDFGIAQINWKTAEHFGLDIKRLTTDLEYSIEAGAIILADFKRMYGHKEKLWWTRYNASNKDKRFIYQKMVERFL